MRGTKPLLKIESQGAPETSGHPHMDKGVSPRQHLRQLPLRALALLQPKLRDIQTIHHTEQILIQMNGIHKHMRKTSSWSKTAIKPALSHSFLKNKVCMYQLLR